MRTQFVERLAAVRSEVVGMGNRVLEMTQKAAHAVTVGSEVEAREVVAADDDVDLLESRTLRDVCVLMVQEAPVARDLRMLTTTLVVLSDFERAADYAVKLARRSMKIGHRFPADMKTDFAELDRMVRQAMALAIKQYLEHAEEADGELRFLERDIDRAYQQARKEILNRIKEDPQRADDLIRTMQMFHALEHIADCAVSISKHVTMHQEGRSTGA